MYEFMVEDGRGGNRAAQVLVVDDESYVRSLFVRWLTESGCRCSEARDPEEACDVLRREPADVMTLDIRMPLGSGLDAVHRFVVEFPDMAIVMVTAVDEVRQKFLWRMRRALTMRRNQPGRAAQPPVPIGRVSARDAHRVDRFGAHLRALRK